MCIISVVVGCAVIVMIMFENEPVHQNNLSPRLITSPISITSIFYPDPIILVLCSTPLLSKSHRTQFSLHFSLFLTYSFLTLIFPPLLPIFRRSYLTGNYDQLLGQNFYEKMSFQFIMDSNGQELSSREKERRKAEIQNYRK